MDIILEVYNMNHLLHPIYYIDIITIEDCDFEEASLGILCENLNNWLDRILELNRTKISHLH